MIGSIFNYMTPEYVCDKMTWNEVMAALEFVAMYEEPKVSSLFGKRYKKPMHKWVSPDSDTFRDDLKDMLRRTKNG